MRGFWSLDASANHLIVATRTHRGTASVQVSVCQCVCVCLFVSDSVELCFGVQCVCVIVYVFQCVCASISVPLAPVCVRQIVASLTFASHSGCSTKAAPVLSVDKIQGHPSSPNNFQYSPIFIQLKN